MVERATDRPLGLATLAVQGGGPDATLATAEQRLATLENGTAAVAGAGGRALLVAALQPLLRPGGEVVVAEEAADDWHRALAAAAGAFGWQARLAATDDLASFERAVGPRSQAIVAAALTPTGEIADIGALAETAKRAQVPLIIDNSELTPALCRPLELGADVVVHRDGRALAGEALALGFVVDGGRFPWMASGRYPVFAEKRAEFGGRAIGEAVGNFAYAAACRALLGEGAPASDASRLIGGLETLPLRMARHAASARSVAEYLSGHARVAAVVYPGLPGDRHHALAERVCPAGAGASVGFTLADGADAMGFVGELRLIGQETPRGAVSSIAAVDAASLRLHVGLEDAADVIADLHRALAFL